MPTPKPVDTISFMIRPPAGSLVRICVALGSLKKLKLDIKLHKFCGDKKCGISHVGGEKTHHIGRGGPTWYAMVFMNTHYFL